MREVSILLTPHTKKVQTENRLFRTQAVQQLQSTSVTAIMDHLGMPKNKASRSKIYRQLKNVGEYGTEIVSGYFKS
jgi:hypothetical protein